MELHAIQSSAKGLSSWTAQSGIQECRETCGGNGYLKCKSICSSSLRGDCKPYPHNVNFRNIFLRN